MATRFEIGEPDSDPSEEWELRGGTSQPDLGQLPGNAGRVPERPGPGGVEEAETVVFQDGIPIARRVTLPEVELLEDVSVFRNRTRSEPPNFWLAVQYGRELRRMSDEFVSSYIERRRLPVSKSAGTLAARVYRKVMDMFPRKDSVDPRPGGDC